jgi:hypothetical protein
MPNPYQSRPLPDGTCEVVHVVATASSAEAALLVDLLNELERNPGRRWCDPGAGLAGLCAAMREEVEVGHG